MCPPTKLGLKVNESKDLWGDSRDFVIGETMLESGFIILSKRLYSYFWNYMCMPKLAYCILLYLKKSTRAWNSFS